MSADDARDAHDAAVSASRTLTDLDRQFAARRPADQPRPAADGAVGWAELEDDIADDEIVARLAADGVIATNRAVGQRSLREFLRQ